MRTQLSVTGVGTADAGPLADHDGLIQAKGDGVTSFRVLGSLVAGGPFVELVAAGTADILKSIERAPYLRLEVTAGTGTVTLYIS